MRWRSFVWGTVVWILAVDAGIAARDPVTLGRVKKDHGAIALATIHDVRRTERVVGDGENRRRVEVFALRLRLVEVLRGPLKRGTDLQVTFLPPGHSRTRTRENEIHEGMKAIARLQCTESRWDLRPDPGSLVRVEDFDDPRIGTWRKVIALWDLGDPRKQLDAVTAGRFDPDRGFQAYCIDVLRSVDGVWTGIDLAGVVTQEQALSLVWEVFAAPDTPIDVVLHCENVFWNRFRLQDWYSHPMRYPILFDAVRRHIASGEEIHHNSFDAAVDSLCVYPEHAEGTYRLLLQVLGGRVKSYKFGTTIRLGLLYHPHTTDPGLAALNREIRAKLVGFLSDPNLAVADGAAVAIAEIALRYATVGPVPEDVLRVLSAREIPGVSERVLPRLAAGLRRARARQALVATADLDRNAAVVLTPPWDAHLGERVLVAGRTAPSDPTQGASLHVGRRLLFVEGLKQWPERQWSGRTVLLTGRLKKLHDQPVFRYHPGEPFGNGMPVREDRDPAEVQRRYVLEDPAWAILDTD
jgi:hypothetical protein